MTNIVPDEKKVQPQAVLYKERKQPRIRTAILRVILLVAFLLIAHFLNLFLQWTVIRLELASGPVFNSPQYSFLGFSMFKQKEIAAIRFFKNSSQPTRIFVYFDLFHSAIFAIWNKNEMTFIDLGPIIIDVAAGFSRVSFFPSSVFIVDHEHKAAVKYFVTSPAAELWRSFLVKKHNAAKPAAKKPLVVSLVIKELEKSRYLKIPYLIYFYLPLLMIVFLTMRYGSAMLIAFFYYVEILFLFDYRKLFVTIPFDWLFKLIKWEITDGQIELIATIMVVIYLFCAVFGLWQWKKSKISMREKSIILFFILLPIFLFF